MAVNEKPATNAEILLEDMSEKIKEGKIPSKIFHDAELFELEKEKIFTQSWCFLAHETEIPNPGDYVVRYIADDSFIVVRDETGKVQVLFNSCSHRGIPLCNAEVGNASHFRCPYHGWTYKNNGNLIGVPFGKELYGEKGFCKEQWGLKTPRVDIYNEMIFGCLDYDAVSLDEYLGDFKWYLDIYLKKSEAGVEVIGAPHRWIMDADWKVGADNFVGDAYHVGVTHRSIVEAGINVPTGLNPHFHKHGVQVSAGMGGVGMVTMPPQSFGGYPETIVEGIKKSLPEQAVIMNSDKYSLMQSHGNLFPNLSFLATAGAPPNGPDDDYKVPQTTMRVWRPIAPGKMEVWSWFIVEKDAPQWYKDASYKAYVLTFGPSGTFEQDDAENFRGITKVAKGSMSKNHYLNYTIGMFSGVQPIADWPGPGTAYPSAYFEANQRAFYSTYLDYMRSK